MLYYELVEEHLSVSSPAIITKTGKYTYEDLHEKVVLTAAQLQKFGLVSGDRCVIINHDTIDTVLFILTCVYLRLCFVLLPEDTPRDQVRYIIEDSQAKVCLNEKERCLAVHAFADRAEPDFPEDLVYILYTSGSSGRPKGVMAGERQVRFCINAINERLRNGRQDRILCRLPLSFDYGLYQVFLSLKFESTLFLPGRVPLQEIPGLLSENRITAFPSMPAMLNMLLKSGMLRKVSLPSLRYITSTGDILPVPVAEELMKLFPDTQIVPMYGLTECKRVSIMPIPTDRSKVLAGSCGRPLKGVSVHLSEVDENGTGELIVSGENVMYGYWNDISMTQKYFFDDPQWGRCLRTGDLFRIDGDGYLYFVGRIKRIIKVDGHRIGSQELEERLLSCRKEEILELRVVGIPHSIHGEQIVVCVYVDKNSDRDRILNELREIMRSWPSRERAVGVYFTDEAFRKNANGKIDDRQLRGNIIEQGFTPL